MQRTRMVHLTTVHSPFEARVVAARLGADGILTELRGGLDAVYPLGEVSVYVPEDELDTAAEILLIEQVESAFDVATPVRPRPSEMSVPTWVVVAVLLLAPLALLAARFL